MKILVTGFDPFGGEAINPAWEAVSRLPKEIEGAEIVTVQIPTVFGDSAKRLFEAVEQHQPHAVVCVGQAGGRFGITPERVAINVDDARIADNKGQQPLDTVIQADGAPAYFTTLPVKAMVEAVKAAGLPASLSNTAGTFVCNHIMYQNLYYLAKHHPNTQGGFIHVPYVTEQVVDKPGQASMALADIVKGLTVCLETLVAYQGKTDARLVGGETH
ncbi:pyroglutamyl-peptidase I [Abiotrophia sp.]|uniref:pyroglutamyl-peptidase I n=1 Tax=Abiotrophia sp. TaxID=76631 RepID=UPI001CAC765D|nr:pyroglutamyl-peptidase I [Abiotrophia sp.]MBF0936099.1 pyroglutamyl-peptidase I [Abiotrophia sp.]